ncbi:MAG: 30S ribosomal protein S20 [Deltaproteobacteria bacterium]|nr:30S ribosomal protein S20 [Deltaproteobacteria bacterium]
MANHPSALKRMKQNQKRRLRNKSYRSRINTTIKKIFTALDDKENETARLYYQQALARLDSAVNKGIIHRKTASRRISRLTKKVEANFS